MKLLGLNDAQLANPSLNVLEALGFTKDDIDKANDYVCGTMMLEKAPHIKDEHLPIFDTANKCGKFGQRYIGYMAHVRIMAAAQPFVSGAISKTVNMPAEAKVADIGDVYVQSWKFMLKAIALYRDGSKLSQPLNSSLVEGLDEIVTLGDENTLDETIGAEQLQENIIEKIKYLPERQKLPKKRSGHIREAHIGGHKVFLRTGEYDDGKLGEIFIDMYKEGASFRGLLNSFAILVSKALQYGVPLSELVDTFTFTRFDPAGPVQGHEAIKYSTSILDYVFRSLGYDYLHRSDFVHIKAVDEDHHNGHNSESIDQTIAFNNKPEDYAPLLVEVEEQDYPLSINGNAGNGHKAALKKEAKAIGYTGEQCEHCGSIRVKRSGSCTVCEDCGSTSGCS